MNIENVTFVKKSCVDCSIEVVPSKSGKGFNYFLIQKFESGKTYKTLLCYSPIEINIINEKGE